MSIVVTKCSPEVVGPSEPGTPTGDIHLSRFDREAGPVAARLLLVFDKPILHPVETIRRALSRALVHYYPMSGRLAAAGAVITCTGEGQGVLFVAASASCAVELLLSSPPAPALRLNDLLVHYPEESLCRPLLLMQVTEFSCGGFVVGVTWNHVLADGAGMGQFLQAVGELARGMSPPSIIPVRSDGSVLAAAPAREIASKADFFSAERQTKGMPLLDFTIPLSLIRRVKAEVGEPCTVFEAAVALLWQCRARAVISDDPESPATLFFTCNMRGLVGAAEGYYGNCSVVESVLATNADDVANGEIKDVVKLIKIVKHKLQDRIKNSGNHDGVEPLQQQPGYNTLFVSSWRNLGLEAPDFGGGGPARVMWYAEQSSFPICVLYPPCKGKDGVNVQGRMVKKEHVRGFFQELAARDQ